MLVGPRMPDAVENHRDISVGRMRSRSVGQRRDGVPEVVLVQGMAVSDYLAGRGAGRRLGRGHRRLGPEVAPPPPLAFHELESFLGDWKGLEGVPPVVLR
jgi:hypothetical protein